MLDARKAETGNVFLMKRLFLWLNNIDMLLMFRKIDWTHEREWRWPYRGDINNFLNHIKEYGIPENIESTPWFDFRSSEISGAGIIVPFAEDIPTVAHDILTLIDRGVIGRNTFKFIIAVESLQSWTQLSEPGALLSCINDNIFEFESFLIYLHLK